MIREVKKNITKKLKSLAAQSTTTEWFAETLCKGTSVNFNRLGKNHSEGFDLSNCVCSVPG